MWEHLNAIVSSKENPTGVGEPGVPPAGPAFANAIAALDKRATELPMEAIGLNLALKFKPNINC